MTSTPNLGRFIRAKREEKKMSLRELARLVDIAPAFQSDIEHGRRYPSLGVLEKTGKVLGVPFAEMKENDTRVRAELKDWLEQNHDVSRILLEHAKSGRPAEELVTAWQRVVKAKKR